MGKWNAQANEIFLKAIEIEPPDQREQFINESCGDNAELRAEVLSLLKAADQAGSFLNDATSAPAAEALSPTRPIAEGPGTMVGRYKLLQKIGEGGFGTVYMAEQEHPVRRRVALKIIKLGMDTKAVIARFEAERQALAMMDHPNIAKVFDAGATETGRPYFVMELVRGVPITDYCDTNNLPVPERLGLFVEVCQAVQHAHQKGIIHRDIKPNNVMVAMADSRPTTKVIDFGIAKATDQRLTEKTLFTEFRQMIGTPQYMSPEQAEMAGIDIDTRSDVYSLGVLLYELLVGSTPFDPKELRSKAYGEMQRMIREVEPPRPSTRLSTLGDGLPSIAAHRRIDPSKLNQILRGELDWIVMRAMEKDRTRRYDTANGLARDIQRYVADEPVEACPPSAIYRTRKFVRKHRRSALTAAVVLFIVLIGAGVSAWQAMRATHAERIVREQKNAVTTERDRAIRAEASALEQSNKAESESRLAQAQYADSLILGGDAFTSGHDYLSAYDRYAQARTEHERLGLPLARLDLSLTRLYRASPPPVWTADLPGGMPKAWVVVPSHNEIVAACADGRYHVLDIVTGAELRTINGDASAVNHLTVANLPEGPWIIATGPKFVRVIDPATGAVEREAADDRAAGFCAISPNGKIAVSGDGQDRGKVTFWETATLQRLTTSASDFPCGGIFSHDGALVATDDGVDIDLWDVKTRMKLRGFSKWPADAKIQIISPGEGSFAFTPDDHDVLYSFLDGTVYSVSVDGLSRSTWAVGDGVAAVLLVPPERNRVITAANDGCVRLFDTGLIGPHPLLLTLVGDRNPLLGAVYVGDAGPRACTATSDFVGGDQAVVVALNDKGRLYAWPLSRRTRERGIDYARAISADGLLFAGGVHGTGGILSASSAGVCDMATGRSLCVMPPDADPYNGESAEALSHDGRRLYTSPPNGVLQAIDVPGGTRQWSIHPRKDYDNGFTLALSPDDQLVAATGDGGSVLILDARTGELLRTLAGNGVEVNAFAFTPDLTPASPPAAGAPPTLLGRHLITSAATATDRMISDWDLGSNAAPRRTQMIGAPTGVTTDGKQITASAGSSGAATMHLFDAATFQSITELGPFRFPLDSFCYVSAGTDPGAWALAGGDKQVVALNMLTGKEALVLETGSDGLLASPDGTLVIAGGSRINLAMPRLYRELSSHPSPAARAAWYAEYGLWAWTRELLERERAAGHDIPALLWARSLWMCGDYAAARPAFVLAVARHEIPDWYADLCVSVGDTPHTIARFPVLLRLEETYKNRREKQGPSDPETGDDRNQLTNAYEAAKRMDLALPLIRETLAAGETNVALLRSTNRGSLELAQALARSGADLLELNGVELDALKIDYAEACRKAEPLLRECMEIRESKAPDNPFTFNAKAMLGGALLGQKKYTDAEPLLLAGYEGMKQRESSMPPQAKLRLMQGAERLTRLYDAQGKTAQSTEWKQTADILRAVLYPSTAAPPSPGDLLARKGDFRAAAAEFVKQLTDKPDDSLVMTKLGALLAEIGDAEAFQAQCHTLLERHAKDSDVTTIRRLSKLCLLAPLPEPDTHVAVELADLALSKTTESRVIAQAQLAKGLAEYRLGHYPEAVQCMEKAIASPSEASATSAKDVSGAAYAILAASYQKLNEPDKAKEAMLQATDGLKLKWLSANMTDLGDHWQDVVIAHLLLREAQTVMQSQWSFRSRTNGI